MERPKKTVKTKAASKSTDAKKSTAKAADPIAKKKVIDDEDDDDFDLPIDDLGRYETFEGYDEEDDF